MQSSSLFKALVKTRSFHSSPARDSTTGRYPDYGRPPSPDASYTRSGQNSTSNASSSKPSTRVCICAPTKHPGSFRCRFHRKQSPTKAYAGVDGKSSITEPQIGHRSLPPPPPSPRRASASRQVAPRHGAAMRAAHVGPSRLSKVTTAAAVSDEVDTAEEGPFRFIKSAAAAGAAAVAAGAGAVGLRKSHGGATDDILSKLGPDAPSAAAAGSSVYEVQQGDNLSSISRKLGTTVEVLKESNGLKDDLLQPGQKLWVPKTHTIQKGETLFKIAKENGTTIGDILKVNNISDPDQIFPGDVLLLP